MPVKRFPALDSHSAILTPLPGSLSAASSCVSLTAFTETPDVLDAPPFSRACPPSQELCSCGRSSSGRDPDERRPRHRRFHRRFHPLRIALRVVADFFIVVWAVINTIQQWPQEWAAIKDFLITAVIFVVWLLHHFGIALMLMAH